MEHGHLQDDRFDQGVHGRIEDLRSALEAPENDASLAENGEEIQHFLIEEIKNWDWIGSRFGRLGIVAPF